MKWKGKEERARVGVKGACESVQAREGRRKEDRKTARGKKGGVISDQLSSI